MALAASRPSGPRAPNSSRSPLTDAQHLRKVAQRTRHLTKITWEGESDGHGQYNFYAASAELIPAGGIKHRETQSLEYHSGSGDRSQRLTVTGIKDGVWRGHLIGTVSVHDLTHLDGQQFENTVKARIAADRIRISYDYGPGTQRTVLKDGLTSEAATAVGLEVPLKKGGVTRIIYDRTDAHGYIVGSSNAYVGRIVELEWPGS
jgi:hypothetical protein